MKVVASTKLTKAERAMREAKKYGAANNGTSTLSPVSRRNELISSPLHTDPIRRGRGQGPQDPLPRHHL